MSKIIWSAIFVVAYGLLTHFVEQNDKAMNECLRTHSVTTCEHTLNR